MSETVPMPVPGNPDTKGKPDGVSGAPDAGNAPNVHGRTAGGESGGGAYKNPHDDTDDAQGGRTHDTSAPGTTTHAGRDPTDTKYGPAPTPAPDRQEREVAAGGRSFTILETSGVAQAEKTGKIGTDAPYEREQEQPGSG